jgi:hypothetical protein
MYISDEFPSSNEKVPGICQKARSWQIQADHQTRFSRCGQGPNQPTFSEDSYLYEKVSHISPTPTGISAPCDIFENIPTPSAPDFVIETSPLPTAQELLFSDSLSDGYFKDSLEPLVEEAKRQLHHDRMRQVERKARVRVPDSPARPPSEVVGFSIPLLSLPSWQVSGIEQLRLPWEPFQAPVAQFSEGDFTNEASLDQWLKSYVPVAEPCLQDLKDRKTFDISAKSREEENCVEYIGVEDTGVETKKRKLDVTEHVQGHVTKLRTPSFRVESAFDNPKAELGSLDSFLRLKMARRKKNSMAPPSQGMVASLTRPHRSTPSIRQTVISNPPDDLLLALCPRISLSTIPGTFVASTTLLIQRSLVGFIRSLYPSARWIEVDFSLLSSNPSASLQPVSALMEPDMLLSPECALLLTSLTRLHQRPLPGSTVGAASRTPLYARIEGTMQRYRGAVVLVTQGLPAKSSAVPLNMADERALGDLRAFVEETMRKNRRKGVPHVEFSPGGERELAHRVVAMMVEYGREWKSDECKNGVVRD